MMFPKRNLLKSKMRRLQDLHTVLPAHTFLPGTSWSWPFRHQIENADITPTLPIFDWLAGWLSELLLEVGSWQ
jgi:hypothetical protein